ncbi:lysylphosphatidylglycerol synthase transmembrane domain-containing protein [Fontisphaera persica]|uniref:lysylphosphatidylglycerol synthase transmembrane domain-containing protein n=1 Tax=Fontisphaera persica TaxID=2974023 RepID=UPI0024C0E015|nr:lysylphosphatidylglycerol synthase transmembrane domain-containing protein [Fontisphaera persica]WCJ58153.1 lysylphosphatidylglycerol synthase transmembrane domain-containing protein [Fontisphaera persica]
MSEARKIWRIGWRLAVCALLMGWIFHAIFMNEGRQVLTARGQHWEALTRAEQWRAAWRLGPPELWSELRQVRPAAFGWSLVFMGGTLLLGIQRWRMALRVHGLELSFSRAAEISLVAHFFNSFMLGSTGGDLIKAYYAARETHHKKAEAVVTVVVDRLIGLWSMLLFAGLMMLFHVPLISTQETLGVTAAVILAMLSGCSVIAVLAFWGGLSRRWPRARELLRRLPRGEWLEKLLESCREFGRAPGFLLKALGLSMLLNVVCVGQYWALGRGLGLTMAPSLYLLLVPMIICIAALPITPSGLGVRENLFVLLLSGAAIGAPATTALSLSLLAYAGFLLWSLAGGVVYITFREKHQLQEVTAGSAAEL